MKSDILDLVTLPPIMIKGQVNEFEWGPGERIYIDTDGDVKLMNPDVNALSSNIELSAIEQRMEEMAGTPKEAMQEFGPPAKKLSMKSSGWKTQLHASSRARFAILKSTSLNLF